MTQALSDPETLLNVCEVAVVVVSEFECASFLYLKNWKGNKLPAFFRLHDHPGKWGATSEFRVGLTRYLLF